MPAPYFQDQITPARPLSAAESNENFRYLAAGIVPNVSFLARASSSQPMASQTFQRVNFATLMRQSGQGTGGYNAATSQYTVPVGGTFDVRGVMQIQPASNTNGVFYLIVFVNGQRRLDLLISPAPQSSEFYGANAAQEIDLVANDVVELQSWNSLGGGTVVGNESYRSAFSMRLIA